MSRCRVAAVALGILVVAAASAMAQDWRTITSLRQVNGEDLLRVDVEYGAGNLDVSPASGNELYRARLRYDAEAFDPQIAYQGDRLKIGLDDGNIRGRNLKAGSLDLRLNPDIPLEMELKFGAAHATLELGGLRLHEAKLSTGASTTRVSFARPNPDRCRAIVFEVGAARFTAVDLGNVNAERLTLSGGVGEVVLDFGGQWKSDMVADISMGLGTLTLRLPRSLGVRVHKGGLLATFDSQGLVKRGDVYFSENWENADHRLNLDLDAALGSIRVVWVDD